MQTLFNFTLSLFVFLCNGFFGSWCWNNLVAKSSIPELSPLNVMGIMMFLCFIKPLSLSKILELEEFGKKKSEERTNMITSVNITRAIIVLLLVLQVYIVTLFK